MAILSHYGMQMWKFACAAILALTLAAECLPVNAQEQAPPKIYIGLSSKSLGKKADNNLNFASDADLRTFKLVQDIAKYMKEQLEEELKGAVQVTLVDCDPDCPDTSQRGTVYYLIAEPQAYLTDGSRPNQLQREVRVRWSIKK